MTGLLPIEEFTRWLVGGERGLSSEAIVSRLTGVPVGKRNYGAYPHDPADFRRCERLLREVPAAREAFGAMADVSDVWARLVDAWDELVALIESEAPGAIDSDWPLGSAPLAYQRMKDLTRAVKT